MNDCEITELPTDQCAHCLHQTGRSDKPVRYVGTEREARFDGACACCGDRIHIGDEIVCADVQGDGSDEWCLLDHTRDPW
ncbi:MAG TPA: hypothetical protein VIL68_05980 [Propionibacteriaceae bacterium]